MDKKKERNRGPGCLSEKFSKYFFRDCVNVCIF